MPQSVHKSIVGFTMMELLYVIVIAGLLSALLLTVFSSARANSHETVCLSNLRQIGMSLKMYESDFGDLPQKLKNLEPTYVPSKQIFRCPVWEAGVSTLSSEHQERIKSIFTSYGYEPAERRYWNEEAPHEAGDPASFHWTWEKMYQMRGEELAVVTCDFHDPFFGKNIPPLGPDGRLQMTRLVLRLNGSVAKSTAYQKGKTILFTDF